MPQDYNHDFKEGPALHLGEEDFWQQVCVSFENSRKVRELMVKDKDGARKITRYGEEPRRFFVDKDGQRVSAESYEYVLPFSEGFAAVSSKSISRHLENSAGYRIWHYIDRNGNIAFQKKFKQASQFHSGRAVVVPFSASEQLVGQTNQSQCTEEQPICIDTRGKKSFRW